MVLKVTKTTGAEDSGWCIWTPRGPRTIFVIDSHMQGLTPLKNLHTAYICQLIENPDIKAVSDTRMTVVKWVFLRPNKSDNCKQ